MTNFRKFLQLTVGRHMYDFWLDCEFYKETVEDLNTVQRRSIYGDVTAIIHLQLLIDDRYVVIGRRFRLAHLELGSRLESSCIHDTLRRFAHADVTILSRCRVYRWR